MTRAAVAVVILLCATAQCDQSCEPPEFGTEGEEHDYCLVGAGPGGLQLGQLLLRAGRSYRIFERSDGPGSFYRKYPVHRKLISLNKRFTGRTDPEFNMRHDWNSLLEGGPDVKPMTARTAERWPPADVLLEYLRDYSQEQEAGHHIAYNHTVLKITRLTASPELSTGERPRRFDLTLQRPDSTKATVKCGVVVMAIGLGQPNIPTESIDGVEYTEQYADLPATGESFTGQTVAVLGSGNTAFETADALAPYTNFIHVWKGRREVPNYAQFTSWESRYVGSVRAINAALFDSYLLKSLDGLPTFSLAADDSVIRPCGYRNGTARKLCMWPKHDPVPSADGTTDEPTVQLGEFSLHDPDAVEFVAQLGNKRVRPESARLGDNQARILVGRSGQPHPFDPNPTARPLAQGGVTHDIEFVTVRVKDLTPDVIDSFAEFSRASGTPFPLQYDRIISCLGWKPNISAFFDPGSAPRMHPGGKFPSLSAEYESNIPDLYFVGASAHGKDYRRSAGGFIHGYRYTARALFKILSVKYEKVPWPGRTEFTDVAEWHGDVGLAKHGCNVGDFDVPDNGRDCPSLDRSPFATLLSKVFDRINVAAGPYQMIGVLGDGVVFRCGPKASPRNITAEFFEELPHEYFTSKYHHLPRLFWSYGYGAQRQYLDQSRTHGTLFQVHLWYYPGDCAASESTPRTVAVTKKEVLRLMETFHTSWNSFSLRYWAGKWLHSHVSLLQPGQSQLAGWEAERGGATAGESIASMEFHQAPEQLSQWASGAHVDVVVSNTLSTPVVVWRSVTATEHAFEQLAVLQPHASGRWVSHERELWQVDTFEGQLLRGWTVDCANGVVQEFLV